MEKEMIIYFLIQFLYPLFFEKFVKQLNQSVVLEMKKRMDSFRDTMYENGENFEKHVHGRAPWKLSRLALRLEGNINGNIGQCPSRSVE